MSEWQVSQSILLSSSPLSLPPSHVPLSPIHTTLPPSLVDPPLPHTVFPATSVSLLPDREGTLYVGTPLELVCTVTVDKTLVDTDVMVVFDFGNLPSDATRTSTQLNSSTFQGVAGFAVLLPAHDDVTYSCMSTLQPVDNTFIDPATNTNVTLTLELAGELSLHPDVNTDCIPPSLPTFLQPYPLPLPPCPSHQ